MAKERTITRTITINTVTVFGANFRSKTFENMTKDITGKIDESNALEIFKAFVSATFAPSQIVSVYTKTEKRGLSEDEFIDNSFVITDETKVNERMITRTIIRNKVSVFGADFNSKEFKTYTFTMNGKLDKWEDKTEILKNATVGAFVPYSVEEITTETEKRGMTEEKFIRLSSIIEDETDE